MKAVTTMTSGEVEEWVRNGPDWAPLVVKCGLCGGRVKGTQNELRKRLERATQGNLFCSRTCLLARNVRPCAAPSCPKNSRTSVGYCEVHYHRFKRNGDPMLKTRRSGLDDGAVIKPPPTPELSPAQIAVLMELADGRARSVGLLSDITAYSMATVRESVYRLRRKYGADSIEIIHQPTMKFRLKEKIPLA